MSVRYEELCPREFRERLAAAPIAYLPLGTLEWHGEHLPLGSDSLQSHGFFLRLAEEVGGIVLPPLFLGPDKTKVIDGEQMIGMDFVLEDCGFRKDKARQLDGSAYWVPEDLFSNILDATMSALARAGFKIVVGHGHGPSTSFFITQIEEWHKRHGLVCMTVWAPEDDPVADHHKYGLMTDHAGANETSIVTALHPELVHIDHLSQDSEEWPLAVGGEDPRTQASAEIGARCLEIQQARMAKILRAELKKL